MSDTLPSPGLSRSIHSPEAVRAEPAAISQPAVGAEQLRQLVADRAVINLSQINHPDALRAHVEFIDQWNTRSRLNHAAGQISVLAAVDPAYRNQVETYVRDRFADNPAERQRLLGNLGLVQLSDPSESLRDGFSDTIG